MNWKFWNRKPKPKPMPEYVLRFVRLLGCYRNGAGFPPHYLLLRCVEAMLHSTYATVEEGITTRDFIRDQLRLAVKQVAQAGCTDQQLYGWLMAVQDAIYADAYDLDDSKQFYRFVNKVVALLPKDARATA